MTPQQVDVLENFLFVLAALIAIPLAWFYAEKRGRRPRVWAFISLVLGFFALLVLRILPDQSKRASLPESPAPPAT
jgi:hypothetical protein